MHSQKQKKPAALTAGLLARKGEALPAAAAFTAEAIAQHFPERHIHDPAMPEQFERGARDYYLSEEEIMELVHPQTEYEEIELDESKISLLPKPDKPLFGKRTVSIEERARDIEDRFNRPAEEETSATAYEVSREAPDLDAIAERVNRRINRFEEIVDQAIADRHGSDVSKDFSGEQTQPETTGEGSDESVKQAQNESVESVDCGVSEEVRRELLRGTSPRSSTPQPRFHLDPNRYLKLKLAAEKLRASPQQIMLVALDRYFDVLDEELFRDCKCLKKGLI